MLSSWAQYIAGVGASTVTLAVLVLVLMALAHLSLRWWIKRRARADDDAAGETPTSDLSLRRWVTRGLRDVLPALALLIWIHGLYFALNLLIGQMGSGTLLDPARMVLNWAYRLGIAGAIFWLLARAGRLIEAFLISLSTRADTSWDDLLLPLAGKAVRRALPLLALILSAPAFSASAAVKSVEPSLTTITYGRWPRTSRTRGPMDRPSFRHGITAAISSGRYIGKAKLRQRWGLASLFLRYCSAARL